MHLEIITTDAGLASLRGAWNRLAGNDPLNGWDWAQAWWYEFRRGGRLAVGVVRDEDDDIVAIAPFYSVRRSVQGHVMQFLGSGKACTDYRRILLGPTDDASGHATRRIEAIVAALLKPSAWRMAGFGPVDVWELEGIDVEEPSMKVLVAALRRQGFSISHDALESTWATDLPNHWERFVASTHRTVRRKIHKAKRRAEDPDFSFHYASTPAEIESIWDEFVRLHQSRFLEKVVGGGCFSDPTFERFLHRAAVPLAKQSRMRLLWCCHRGIPISIQMYLLGDGTAFMYQSGFDPEYAHLEPGHLLYSFTVAHLIENGFTKLDFLRGDESYKADWNGRPNPLARTRCVSPRVSSRLRDSMFLAARGSRRLWRELRAKAGRPQPFRDQRKPYPRPSGSSPEFVSQELVEV